MINACVCVCVCLERERERERETLLAFGAPYLGATAAALVHTFQTAHVFSALALLARPPEPNLLII